MNRTCLIIAAVIGVAAIITGVAHLPIDTLQRLELQSEANTCRDVLKSDQGPLITIYCSGVIHEHDAIVKAYKEEQIRKLLERVREKG